MMSIIAVVTAAAIFASVTANVNNALAQTTGSTSSSDRTKYRDFQSCLTSSGTGGFATKQQIMDCFDQFYNTGGSSSSDTGTSSDSGRSTHHSSGSSTRDSGSS